MAILALIAGLTAAPAPAATFPHRTLRLSVAAGGGTLDGGIADAVLSGAATTVAFTTTATNFTSEDPDGGLPDVYTLDFAGGQRRRVSETPDGAAADGGSRSPAISTFGRTVAFVSDATNLVAADTNGVSDVFARDVGGPVVLVSAGIDGEAANGPSSQPDISGDGRRVVFTSAASNLVPGDTNGVPDVFVRDLGTGVTRRLSVSTAGAQARGGSSAPAISTDGTSVAFESAAANLVDRDTNNVNDVFWRSIAGNRTVRVSVATSGRQQDKAIAPPFATAPDISGNGRYVVFDSDATTLYRQDTNRRTDVYLRDTVRGVTTLVSANSLNVQGNNDSITPRITPNGRFVTFQSFASNLVPDDGPREDLFARDLRNGTTVLLNATDTRRRRRPEPGGQLLQRAAISDDGRFALFRSAAPEVVPGVPGGRQQLYARVLTAPAVRIRGPIKRSGGRVRLRVGADDPGATRFLCRVDRAVPFVCGPAVSVRRTAGRILRVRAGGAGILWSAAKTVRLGAT